MASHACSLCHPLTPAVCSRGAGSGRQRAASVSDPASDSRASALQVRAQASRRARQPFVSGQSHNALVSSFWSGEISQRHVFSRTSTSQAAHTTSGLPLLVRSARSPMQIVCSQCRVLLPHIKEAFAAKQTALMPRGVCANCQDADDVPVWETDSDEDDIDNVSGRDKRAHAVKQLWMGKSPIEILEGMPVWSPPEFWSVVDFLNVHGRIADALEVFQWWRVQEGYRSREQHYTKFISMLGMARMPELAQQLFDEMRDSGVRPGVASYTCLLQGYAGCGLFEQAEQVLKEMIMSGDAKPNTVTYTGLIHAYGERGLYDEMWRVFNNMKTVGIPLDVCTYSTLIQAYAKGGLFGRMQKALRELIVEGWDPDPTCLNAVVRAYAGTGSVKEMEKHYRLLLEYRYIARQTTVRAMALAYVRSSYFFQLGEFVRSVGLRRPTMGNFLWNALLLSYAANFSMDNLVGQFNNMKEAGFTPDITTYNIMVLAFSQMQWFWDLRVAVLEMQAVGVSPDLVTYGAVVDSFLAGRLKTKLPDALAEMRTLHLVAEVATDQLVFEGFGKGNFHVACENLVLNMEAVDLNNRTYANLIGFYLKTMEKRKLGPQNQLYSRRA